MATVDKNVAAIVARHPDVRKAVRAKANEIAGRARSLLATHRRAERIEHVVDVALELVRQP